MQMLSDRTQSSMIDLNMKMIRHHIATQPNTWEILESCGETALIKTPNNSENQKNTKHTEVGLGDTTKTSYLNIRSFISQ